MKKEMIIIGEVYDGLVRLLVLHDNSLRLDVNGMAGASVGFVADKIAYFGLNSNLRAIGQVYYFEKKSCAKLIPIVQEDEEKCITSEYKSIRTYESP